MASWELGTITVPSSTGTVEIDTGDRPAAVFFFGTNWLTEDSPVTFDVPGWFRGMAAPHYSTATLLQNASAVALLGDAHWTDNYGILCLDNSGGTNLRYRATIAFTSTGFTADFNVVTGGGYKVAYAALLDVDNVGAFVGSINQGGLAFGWKAGACLLHGCWAGPSRSGTDRTQEFYGGAGFPGSGSGSWLGAGLSVLSFPTSPSGQWDEDLDHFPANIVVCTGGHFLSAFLITSNIKAYPTGTNLENFAFTGDSEDGGMVVAWDDENCRTGFATPAASVGQTAQVSGLPFAPAVVTGYALGHSAPGQGSGLPRHGHGGLFLAGENFQWSCLVDENPVQSFDLGFIDNADGIGSWHGGTIEMTSDGFIMHTTEASAGPQTMLWQAFGAEVVAPGFFRVIN